MQYWECDLHTAVVVFVVSGKLSRYQGQPLSEGMPKLCMHCEIGLQVYYLQIILDSLRPVIPIFLFLPEPVKLPI